MAVDLLQCRLQAMLAQEKDCQCRRVGDWGAAKQEIGDVTDWGAVEQGIGGCSKGAGEQGTRDG